MPKRLDQMAILERVDIKYEIFFEREEIRASDRRLLRFVDNGALVILLSVVGYLFLK
jgi:hypothetical protein